VHHRQLFVSAVEVYGTPDEVHRTQGVSGDYLRDRLRRKTLLDNRVSESAHGAFDTQPCRPLSPSANHKILFNKFGIFARYNSQEARLGNV
jgi:hypothetical protein